MIREICDKDFSTMYRKVDEQGIKSESGHKEMYRGLIGLRVASRDYLSGFDCEVATCLIFGVRTIGFACDIASGRMIVNRALRGNKLFDDMVQYFIDKNNIASVEDVDNLPTKVVPGKAKKSLADMISAAPVVDDIEGL